MTRKVLHNKYIRAEKTTKNRDAFKVLVIGICIALPWLSISLIYSITRPPPIDHYKYDTPPENHIDLFINETWGNLSKK